MQVSLEVSRPGVIPGPTVKVRMEENRRNGRHPVQARSAGGRGVVAMMCNFRAGAFSRPVNLHHGINTVSFGPVLT